MAGHVDGEAATGGEGLRENLRREVHRPARAQCLDRDGVPAPALKGGAQGINS